jgi:hypothetical protein
MKIREHSMRSVSISDVSGSAISVFLVSRRKIWRYYFPKFAPIFYLRDRTSDLRVKSFSRDRSAIGHIDNAGSLSYNLS